MCRSAWSGRPACCGRAARAPRPLPAHPPWEAGLPAAGALQACWLHGTRQTRMRDAPRPVRLGVDLCAPQEAACAARALQRAHIHPASRGDRPQPAARPGATRAAGGAGPAGAARRGAARAHGRARGGGRAVAARGAAQRALREGARGAGPPASCLGTPQRRGASSRSGSVVEATSWRSPQLLVLDTTHTAGSRWLCWDQTLCSVAGQTLCSVAGRKLGARVANRAASTSAAHQSQGPRRAGTGGSAGGAAQRREPRRKPPKAPLTGGGPCLRRRLRASMPLTLLHPLAVVPDSR